MGSLLLAELGGRRRKGLGGLGGLLSYLMAKGSVGGHS